jgi:hypothetical protein
MIKIEKTMKTKILLVLLLFIVSLCNSFSQTYYSRQSGNWNDNNTWSLISHTGTPAPTAPAALANVIIGNGHTVTSTDSLNLAVNLSITVSNGATLVLQNGNANTILNLTVAGTLRLEGGNLNVTTPLSNLNFNNGSTYIHARDGGTIPLATWQLNSTCEITGVTTTMPTGFESQNFGNLIWNCSNQNIYCAFNANFNIQGTFRVLNSHDGTSPLGIAVSSSNTQDYTVTTQHFVMDNLTANRAAFYPYAGSSASRTGTLAVIGDLTIKTNNITGVLSGIGTSRIVMQGSANTTFDFNASFNFYSNAVWEVEVNKSGGAKVTFTSPINFVSWPAASGTPVSILDIQSGEAEIPGNVTLSTSVVQGSGILTMGANANLLLDNKNSSYNNTFSGTFNTIADSYVTFNTSVPQNIFIPTIGTYGSIRINSSSYDINLFGNLTLTGTFWDEAGKFKHNNNTVTFAGTSPQTIRGIVEFYNFNINNNTSLFDAGTQVRFIGQLSIDNDKYLSIGAGTLFAVYTPSSMPSINGGINKYIVTDGPGEIKIRNESGITLVSSSLPIPMGYTQPSKYAGITFPFSNLNNGTEISIQVKAPGTVSYPNITAPIRVDVVWKVQLPVFTAPNTSSSISVFYAGSTVGGFTGGQAYYHNGTNWIGETTGSSNASSTQFTPTSFTNTTRYYAVFASATDFYTLGDGAAWDVNSNLWSNDGTTPCNCSPNGIANANVRIRHNASIPPSSVVTPTTTIDIQQPVTLTSDIAFTAQNLYGVSGATLKMNINSLPTISGINSFATTNGTIIDFASNIGGTIPDDFGGNLYKTLIISGAGIKSFAGTPIVIIQENLTIKNGATLNVDNANLSVGGNTIIENGGSFTDGGNSGSSKFSGSITINAGGSFSAIGGLTNSSNFTFEKDITNNGNFDLLCGCNISFNSPSSTIILVTANAYMNFGASSTSTNISFNFDTRFAGNNPIILNASLNINNNVSVSNSNTAQVVVEGVLNGVSTNSTWQQDNNAVLVYRNNVKPMIIGNLTANVPGNVVRYESGSTNNIKETTYYNLELFGISVKLFSPNTIVENDLTADNSTGNLDLQGNILRVRGNWIGKSLGSLQVLNGRVIFDGTAPQTIFNSTDFDILEIANSAHVALGGADNSANRITLTQGRLQIGNSIFTLKATPATDQITQTFTNTSTSYIETNGTGNLTRQNLVAGTAYVFPIGDASVIRHITITPIAAGLARAVFVSGITPTPPPSNTDLAAGMWLLQGMNGATVSFVNSGAVGFASKVYRLNGSTWEDTGITTTFSSGIYTATPLNFAAGETYTIFGQTAAHTVVLSSFTKSVLPDGSMLLSAQTNYNLPTKFISTNTNVAQILNGNKLVITYNNADEFTDILAFSEGQNPIPPSDTVQVMRIYNFGYINALHSDIEKKILLYPNPTSDEVFVSSLDNSLQIESISVFNALGQNVVLKTKENKLSLTHLPVGVYVAEIHTSQGLIRKKVTKR